MSSLALADEPKTATPHEPAGFISGAVIGGFAAGPIGAVMGAGLGTWLGNRVHRAGDAKQAEASVAALQAHEAELQRERAALLDEVRDRVGASRATDRSEVLDGLQGDVLFRTGSAEITPEIAHQIQVLALAVARSPALKVRLDGYADPRGAVEANLVLSQSRANAVRDLFRDAGISDERLEVNAYGKSQSVAADSDGYALERRVRLTLRALGGAAVAQAAATD